MKRENLHRILNIGQGHVVSINGRFIYPMVYSVGMTKKCENCETTESVVTVYVVEKDATHFNKEVICHDCLASEQRMQDDYNKAAYMDSEAGARMVIRENIEFLSKCEDDERNACVGDVCY